MKLVTISEKHYVNLVYTGPNSHWAIILREIAAGLTDIRQAGKLLWMANQIKEDTVKLNESFAEQQIYGLPSREEREPT